MLSTRIIGTTSHPISPDLARSQARFAAEIKARCELLELSPAADYRRVLAAAAEPSFFTPLDECTAAAVEARFAQLSRGAAVPTKAPVSFGRTMPLVACQITGVARLSFEEACGGHYGAADYIALAQVLPHTRTPVPTTAHLFYHHLPPLATSPRYYLAVSPPHHLATSPSCHLAIPPPCPLYYRAQISHTLYILTVVIPTMAQAYHTLVLTDVPRMSLHQRDKARRSIAPHRTPPSPSHLHRTAPHPASHPISGAALHRVCRPTVQPQDASHRLCRRASRRCAIA